jgi:hypothetical protein
LEPSDATHRNEKELMTAVARNAGAIILVTRAPPTAEALDEEINLTLPVMGPLGAERASVEVFLTVEFARSAIAELTRAVGVATKSARWG